MDDGDEASASSRSVATAVGLPADLERRALDEIDRVSGDEISATQDLVDVDQKVAALTDEIEDDAAGADVLQTAVEPAELIEKVYPHLFPEQHLTPPEEEAEEKEDAEENQRHQQHPRRSSSVVKAAGPGSQTAPLQPDGGVAAGRWGVGASTSHSSPKRIDLSLEQNVTPLHRANPWRPPQRSFHAKRLQQHSGSPGPVTIPSGSPESLSASHQAKNGASLPSPAAIEKNIRKFGGQLADAAKSPVATITATPRGSSPHRAQDRIASNLRFLGDLLGKVPRFVPKQPLESQRLMRVICEDRGLWADSIEDLVSAVAVVLSSRALLAESNEKLQSEVEALRKQLACSSDINQAASDRIAALTEELKAEQECRAQMGRQYDKKLREIQALGDVQCGDKQQHGGSASSKSLLDVPLSAAAASAVHRAAVFRSQEAVALDEENRSLRAQLRAKDAILMEQNVFAARILRLEESSAAADKVRGDLEELIRGLTQEVETMRRTQQERNALHEAERRALQERLSLLDSRRGSERERRIVATVVTAWAQQEQRSRAFVTWLLWLSAKRNAKVLQHKHACSEALRQAADGFQREKRELLVELHKSNSRIDDQQYELHSLKSTLLGGSSASFVMEGQSVTRPRRLDDGGGVGAAFPDEAEGAQTKAFVSSEDLQVRSLRAYHALFSVLTGLQRRLKLSNLSVAPLDLESSCASTFQLVVDWIEKNFSFLSHVLSIETRLLRTKVELTYISIKIQPRLRHLTRELELAKNMPPKLNVLRQQFAGYADLHKRIRALRGHIDATSKALLTAVDEKKQAEIDVLTSTFEADVGAFSRALEHHNRVQFSFALAITYLDKRKLTVQQTIEQHADARAAATKPSSAGLQGMHRVLSKAKCDKLLGTSLVSGGLPPTSGPSSLSKASSSVKSPVQRSTSSCAADPLGSPLQPVREFTRGSDKSFESDGVVGSRPGSQQQMRRAGSAELRDMDPDVDSRPVTRGRTPTPTGGIPIHFADIPNAVLDGNYENVFQSNEDEANRHSQQDREPGRQFFNGLKGLTAAEVAKEHVHSLFPYRQPSRTTGTTKVVDPWEERRKGQLFIGSILRAGPDGVIARSEFKKLKTEASGGGAGLSGHTAITSLIRVGAPQTFVKAKKMTKRSLLDPISAQHRNQIIEDVGGGASASPPPSVPSPLIVSSATSLPCGTADSMKFLTRNTLLRGSDHSTVLEEAEQRKEEDDIVARLLPGFRRPANP
jgi:hypothetical protein